MSTQEKTRPIMTTTLALQGSTIRGRLSDSVYETLLEAIISGKLARGTIVSEVSLAKQLEVSRTPVHDALRQLAKDGLVEQRAGRRAVIASFSKEDLFDIFEMRMLLESAGARRAAQAFLRAAKAGRFSFDFRNAGCSSVQARDAGSDFRGIVF